MHRTSPQHFVGLLPSFLYLACIVSFFTIFPSFYFVFPPLLPCLSFVLLFIFLDAIPVSIYENHNIESQYVFGIFFQSLPISDILNPTKNIPHPNMYSDPRVEELQSSRRAPRYRLISQLHFQECLVQWSRFSMAKNGYLSRG